MAAKPRGVIIIGIVAVAVAAVASWLLYSYLTEREKMMEEAVATEQIVVAARDVPIGTVIDRTQVKTTAWPKANVPPGAVLAPGDAVGRITLQTLQVGDPITEGKLVPKGGVPGIMTYKVPEGHRAMTVAVDQVSGVAGFISPGNMVDVVLTTTPPETGKQLSKIIQQNVPVLATGQIIEQEKDGKPVIVPTVTIDVTPEEAEKLALATAEGRLQLLLRRSGDVGETATTGATIRQVLGAAPAAPVRVAKGRPGVKKAPPQAVAAPLPPGAKWRTLEVEVIRNGQKSVQTFRVPE